MRSYLEKKKEKKKKGTVLYNDANQNFINPKLRMCKPLIIWHQTTGLLKFIDISSVVGLGFFLLNYSLAFSMYLLPVLFHKNMTTKDL